MADDNTIMHEPKPDFLYELLDIPRNASREEIDQACVNL